MGGLWMALLLSLVGVLSAASSEIARPCGAAVTPSSFDYLVLASMADSQRPISMASYRATRESKPEVTVPWKATAP
jgi:hypothetical protein